MARDRFQRFLGTFSTLTSKESEAEPCNSSNTENELPNAPISEQKFTRKRTRLTIHSDDEISGESDGVESNESGKHIKSTNHDIFALQRKSASRHFQKSSDRGPKEQDEIRHSARLSNRSFVRNHHFYLDELEASDPREGDVDYDYEERSLTAFQRYNLRDRKRPTLVRNIRHSDEGLRHASVRYNLRPHRGTRVIGDYQVPWTIAEQFVLAEKPRRRLIPDKALIEATPELQPYESQIDVNSGNVDDSASNAGSENAIVAQKVQTASSEPPFLRIAGMDEYVRQLKEMVVFPLLYPSFFNQLGVSPPRGVLFHGPPGTGKTLMARLLAESCSSATRKVSFFMRNGSDCLSKWIGEAERNMKLLFQKAKECQPAIIFFDEIDGLAPERSGRADQSHISLVSTLLALMDGLDDRGNVVVIGATNRIHALDPALRRPGRFDREFFFGLPDELTRLSILKIHTRTWAPLPESALLASLANMTQGFSGADLKGLCTEAALQAIRRMAPEAYDSVNIPSESHFSGRQITVAKKDFYDAFRKVVPSTRRYDMSEQPSIPLPFSLLFDDCLHFMVENIKGIIGSPIPSAEPSLMLDSPWVLAVNRINFCGDLPSAISSRLQRLACSQIVGFRTVLANMDKLNHEMSIMDQLMGGPFREAKSVAPSILIIPDFEGHQREGEVAAALGHFMRLLLPSDPVLVVTFNRSCEFGCACYTFNLPQMEEKQAISFLEYVLCREVKSIVNDKLSRLETIVEYGRNIGIDLSLLLISPFSDYDAFLSSTSILPNQAELVDSIQALLPLGTEEWYKGILNDGLVAFQDCAFLKYSRLRMNIIRRIQNLDIPTIESVSKSYTAAIEDALNK